MRYHIGMYWMLFTFSYFLLKNIGIIFITIHDLIIVTYNWLLDISNNNNTTTTLTTTINTKYMLHIETEMNLFYFQYLKECGVYLV